MKLKWKVQPAPTGRYRSFENRGWPDACWNGDQPAVTISCVDEYTAARARDGSHGELTVRVADHSCAPFKWRTLKQRFATLQAAKDGVDVFFAAHPEFAPDPAGCR